MSTEAVSLLSAVMIKKLNFKNPGNIFFEKFKKINRGGNQILLEKRSSVYT